MTNCLALSREETKAKFLVETGAGSADGIAPPDGVVAELLRETLSRFALPNTHLTDWAPVYVTRITNAVQQQLDLLWPFYGDKDSTDNDNHATIKRVLGAMQDLGECVHLGDGYWLPMMTRCVQPPSGRPWMFSGLGTRALRRTTRADVRQLGLARVVCADAPSPDAGVWQDFEIWRGPVPDLRAWTQEVLARARKSLKQSAQEFVDFEVYAADVARPQYFRWVRPDSLQRLPSDLVLCRSTGEPRAYWLGRLMRVDGLLSLTAESRIEPSLVRRLQYGLDLQSGVPTFVQLSVGNSTATLVMRSGVPDEERRVLLASSESPPDFTRLPLSCTVPLEYLPVLRTTIESLGMKIRETSSGG